MSKIYGGAPKGSQWQQETNFQHGQSQPPSQHYQQQQQQQHQQHQHQQQQHQQQTYPAQVGNYTLPGVINYLTSEFTNLERFKIMTNLEKNEMKYQLIQLQSEVNALKFVNNKQTHRIQHLENENLLLKKKHNEGKSQPKFNTIDEANGNANTILDNKIDIPDIDLDIIKKSRYQLTKSMREVVQLLKTPSINSGNYLDLPDPTDPSDYNEHDELFNSESFHFGDISDSIDLKSSPGSSRGHGARQSNLQHFQDNNDFRFESNGGLLDGQVGSDQDGLNHFQTHELKNGQLSQVINEPQENKSVFTRTLDDDFHKENSQLNAANDNKHDVFDQNAHNFSERTNSSGMTDPAAAETLAAPSPFGTNHVKRLSPPTSPVPRSDSINDNIIDESDADTVTFDDEDDDDEGLEDNFIKDNRAHKFSDGSRRLTFNQFSPREETPQQAEVFSDSGATTDSDSNNNFEASPSPDAPESPKVSSSTGPTSIPVSPDTVRAETKTPEAQPEDGVAAWGQGASLSDTNIEPPTDGESFNTAVSREYTHTVWPTTKQNIRIFTDPLNELVVTLSEMAKTTLNDKPYLLEVWSTEEGKKVYSIKLSNSLDFENVLKVYCLSSKFGTSDHIKFLAVKESTLHSLVLTGDEEKHSLLCSYAAKGKRIVVSSLIDFAHKWTDSKSAWGLVVGVQEASSFTISVHEIISSQKADNIESKVIGTFKSSFLKANASTVDYVGWSKTKDARTQSPKSSKKSNQKQKPNCDPSLSPYQVVVCHGDRVSNINIFRRQKTDLSFKITPRSEISQIGDVILSIQHKPSGSSSVKLCSLATDKLFHTPDFSESTAITLLDQNTVARYNIKDFVVEVADINDLSSFVAIGDPVPNPLKSPILAVKQAAIFSTEQPNLVPSASNSSHNVEIHVYKVKK